MNTGNYLVRSTFALCLVAIIHAPVAVAQALSAEERRLAAYVDAHANEAIALLEQVTNIASATENHAGVRQVGQAFRAELAALGFSANWVDMSGVNRAGHLIAERRGARGKRLLLLGHLDTVLQGKRFERDGNLARGNGVVDMKGGIVVMVAALKALRSIGALEQSRLIVVLTGDEEAVGAPSAVSRRDMIEAARRSDLALSFEALVGETATVARRGGASWRLQVSGVTGHSSRIFGPQLGSGAIFEAARILTAFHEQLRGEPYLTFNPSVIVGGTDVAYDDKERRGTAAGKTNVVPRTVIVEGDLRFLSEGQKESAKAKMREIVARSLPRARAEITFKDGLPAMAPTPGNDALLKQLDRASRDLGLGEIKALDPMERGGGDISFVAPIISGLDGLGARGGDAHAPGEYVELDSLALQAKRVAVLIYRLTR